MIAVLTDPAVGGTFVTWSIHYLRGDDRYFLVEDDNYHTITKNILTNKNAHNFIPNQPNRGKDRGLQKLYHMMNKLCDIDDQGVVYLHNFDDDVQTRSATEYVSSKIEKKILVSTKSLPLYHTNFSPRSAIWISATEYSNDPDVIFQSFNEKYFASSHKVWVDQGIFDTVWDKREFIALNFDFRKVAAIEDCFDCSVEHYRLNALELWNTESHVQDLFDYLQVPIDQHRLDSWRDVYRRWQQFHESRLLFAWYFDEIINYIINGYSLDLKRFNLDLVQEACIQSHLIYNHNLNLKTWQLEKFSNTKHLHNLLEPNFHNIKKK